MVDLGDFPPVEADNALEPGLRKSVTHLRNFADLPDSKRKTIDFKSRVSGRMEPRK